MAYESIDYTPPDVEIPEAIARLIEAADARYDTFCDEQGRKRYPRYVPSEPLQVYAALKFATEQALPLGPNFIEWGSGFGVATGIAALLDYQATGIEIQADLVAIAEALLQQNAIDATILNTSYIPEGLVEYESLGSTDFEEDCFGSDEAPYYEDMEIPINEVDLFFVYPWPGEQEMMLKLFDTLAGEGAILITYLGDGETNIYRKIVSDLEDDF